MVCGLQETWEAETKGTNEHHHLGSSERKYVFIVRSWLQDFTGCFSMYGIHVSHFSEDGL